jgi:hypothetical protein
MKYTWIAALVIAALPAFAQAQRYDRGTRYHGGGSSHSSFGFSIGFGSVGYGGNYSYANIGYGYGRPIYAAPVRYYPPVVYSPPPVVVYQPAPVYVAPPVYVPPVTYYQPAYTTTYYSASPYYCSPAVTSYTSVRYHYGH